MQFTIKQGDTSPPLEVTLAEDGVLKDLTGAAVRFIMEGRIDSPATVAGLGKIKYQFTAVDSSVAGCFRGEFEVTLPSGKIETFPNFGYITIIIPEKLV